jgi:hypothetical protein
MIKKTIESLAEEIDNKYSYYEDSLDSKKSKNPVIESEHDWNLYSLTTNQERMFIMQNPGEGLKKKEKIEISRNLVSDWQNSYRQKQKTSRKKLEKTIKNMQEGLIAWLINDNEHFWKFFKILSDKEIIHQKIDSLDDYKPYITNHFLEDFYVTDLFKYRVSTGKLDNALYGKKKEHFKVNLMKTLENEIEQVRPNIIFIFSSRTWGTFYEYFKNNNSIKIIGERPSKLAEEDENLKEEDENKVTKVHGLMFELKIRDKKIIVIPLCHFSPNCYNKLIFDSYFRYFRKRIEKNRKILNMIK